MENIKLSNFWNKKSRQAFDYEVLEMPKDSFFDRKGDTQELFLTKSIEVFYLPEDSEAIKILNELTKEGGCIKQSTRAMIVSSNNDILGIGANAGKKLDYCPRVKNNCKTGEGYEYCRNKEKCNQIEHAEVMAIYDTIKNQDSKKGEELMNLIEEVNECVFVNNKTELKNSYENRNNFIKKNNIEKDLSIVLDGHWWVCQSCMSAMIDFGITKLYLRENAKELFDWKSENNILPKFDEEGKIMGLSCFCFKK